MHGGTTWLPAVGWDINRADGRRADKLPRGIQKFHTASDSDVPDDNPSAGYSITCSPTTPAEPPPRAFLRDPSRNLDQTSTSEGNV